MSTKELRCTSGLHIIQKEKPCDKCRDIRRAIWNSSNPIKAQKEFNETNAFFLAEAAKFCNRRDQLIIEAGLAQIAETERLGVARAKVKQDQHLSRRRVMSNNARAIRMHAKGVLSIALIDQLYKLQKGRCPCCKAPLGKSFHVDHIVPLSKGGSNTDDNIQLLRSRCNMSKNAKDPILFMQMNGFLL